MKDRGLDRFSERDHDLLAMGERVLRAHGEAGSEAEAASPSSVGHGYALCAKQGGRQRRFGG